MDLPLLAEPFRIKVVEPIRRTTREEREAALAHAGYNLFLLRAEDVYVDLLTDSGVGAMSDRQWAGMMTGDESYAGARNFVRFRETIERVLGFPHVLPTHQGRAAEHILDAALVKDGDVVPGNAHFDTTKAHIEHRGATALDCTVSEAAKAASDHPFKGNVDVPKLRETLAEHAPHGRVPYVLVTVTCNTAGGQPVSLANLQEVRAACDEHNVRLFLDIARYAENAYFIKQREPAYRDWSVPRIARAIMDLADGATMSAKKDALVNIGGFLALRDKALYDQVAPYCVLFEGFVTYGGLAGRDLEALAIGLEEGLDEAYLGYRIGQVHELGRRLHEAGVPILTPVGGHAVYIDAGSFLPHIPREEFPGQALTIELYREAGIRGVEIGGVMAGRDPTTHENRYPDLELVRLAIPRRTYTSSHLEFVAAAVKAVHARRDTVKGVAFAEEAPILRHFTSTFRPLPAAK